MDGDHEASDPSDEYSDYEEYHPQKDDELSPTPADDTSERKDEYIVLYPIAVPGDEPTEEVAPMHKSEMSNHASPSKKRKLVEPPSFSDTNPWAPNSPAENLSTTSFGPFNEREFWTRDQVFNSWNWEDQDEAEINTDVTFSGCAEMSSAAKSASSELDYLQLFLTKEVIDNLIQETNCYAWQTTGKQAKFEPVTRAEMMGYIGLTVGFGLNPLSAIANYWLTDVVFHMPFFGKVMSRGRYNKISRYLHIQNNTKMITDTSGRPLDKLFKVRPLLESLVKSFQTHYHPGRDLSVDEQTHGTKGEVNTLLNTRDTATKWGIKVWALCDVETNYMLNFKVYTGDQEKSLPLRIVDQLVGPYLGKGHHLFIDDFNTSPDLLQCLLAERTLATGKVSQDHPNMPVHLQTQEDAVFLRSNGVTACRWKDEMDVYYLSTIHGRAFQQVPLTSTEVTLCTQTYIGTDRSTQTSLGNIPSVLASPVMTQSTHTEKDTHSEAQTSTTLKLSAHSSTEIKSPGKMSVERESPSQTLTEKKSAPRSSPETNSPVKTAGEKLWIGPSTETKPSTEISTEIKPPMQTSTHIKLFTQKSTETNTSSKMNMSTKTSTAQASREIKPSTQTYRGTKSCTQRSTELESLTQTSTESNSPVQTSKEMKPYAQTSLEIKSFTQTPVKVKSSPQTLTEIKPSCQPSVELKSPAQTLKDKDISTQTSKDIDPSIQKSMDIKSPSRTSSKMKLSVQTSTEMKPSAIVSFNNAKGSVGMLDYQLTHNFMCHKTLKWWKKVFWRLIDLAIVNAYILYKVNNPTTYQSPKKFRLKIVEQLCHPCMGGSAARDMRRRDQSQSTGRLSQAHEVSPTNYTRRVCTVCRKRTSGGCLTCGDSVRLHLVPCLGIYHAFEDYQSEYKKRKTQD